MFKKVLMLICICLGIAYPFVIYAGLSFGLIDYLLPVLATVFIVRAILSFRQNSQFKIAAIASALVAAILCIASELFSDLKIALYYPVFINFLFLMVFGISLFSKSSIITRLAMLSQKTEDLPPYVIRYTTAVSKIWCVFFLVNGFTAFLTVQYGDIGLWTLYNGLISYILMGLLFACEFIVRTIIKKRNEH
ncbi:MAG: hypothetical protein ACI4UM_09075 [Succinivibrio sp.]